MKEIVHRCLDEEIEDRIERDPDRSRARIQLVRVDPPDLLRERFEILLVKRLPETTLDPPFKRVITIAVDESLDTVGKYFRTLPVSSGPKYLSTSIGVRG